MDTPRDMTALQGAADYVVVSKNVRASGIGATIFGVLALFAAILPPSSLPLAGLGAVLSVIGLWNLTNPHPVGILLSGVCLMLAGLWNIGSGFVFAAAGGTPSVGWQVVGVFQLMWGMQAFQRYRRFAHAFESVPGEVQRKHANQIVNELRRAKPKQSADVIVFAAGGMMPRVVKARLMPEGAVCLIGNGDDVRFVGREAFDMQVTGSGPRASFQKVRVRIADLSFQASIAPGHLERFEEWKGGAAVPRALAA